jgi:hypothetical protein
MARLAGAGIYPPRFFVTPCSLGSGFVIFSAMRRNWSRGEQIRAMIAMVVSMVAFVYFIFFLADPITEWLLDVLGLSD